jgi:hypothetical protein
MRQTSRLIAISIFGLFPGCAAAQVARQVQAPLCNMSCTVVREPYVTLGSPNDPELVNVGTAVARDSRGRFYATATGSSPVIAFDAKGKFITTIGRRGDGPGEFRRIAVIDVGVGDTLYVREERGAISVFAPDYHFVRQLPVNRSLATDFLALGGGRVVTGSSSAAARDPIMAITNGHDWLGFLGGGREPAGCEACSIRSFAYRDESTFWAASAYSYRLELWNVNGTLERDIRPSSEWLSAEPYVRRIADSKPAPYIVGIASDRRGLLWVLGYAPSNDYVRPPECGNLKPNLPPCPRLTPDSVWKAARARSLAAVDVIDPASGAVIASARYQKDDLRKVHGLTSDVDGTLGFQADYAYDGSSLVRVWRLTLRR